MPKKAIHKTARDSIARFDQIINIGAAMSGDFQRLGLKKPQDLIGKDPVKLYQTICRIDQQFHDPCVLDTYLATVDYMNGKPPQVWWKYTKQRKSEFTSVVDDLREQYSG